MEVCCVNDPTYLTVIIDISVVIGLVGWVIDPTIEL